MISLVAALIKIGECHMVAPSFQSYKIITPDPFLKNNKYYITVEHPNTHHQRDVRWYNEKEYNKLYGPKVIPASDFDSQSFKGLKEARGFSKGPIIVIRNSKGYNKFTQEEEEYLERSSSRYAVGIGWYFGSDNTPSPKSLPPCFKYIPLTWEEFRAEDDKHMRSPQELSKIISNKAKQLNI